MSSPWPACHVTFCLYPEPYLVAEGAELAVRGHGADEVIRSAGIDRGHEGALPAAVGGHKVIRRELEHVDRHVVPRFCKLLLPRMG